MHKYTPRIFVGFMLMAILVAADFEPSDAKDESSTLPPEPTVTYAPEDARPGQTISHGELISSTDEVRRALHAQHHSHGILETARFPATSSPRR